MNNELLGKQGIVNDSVNDIKTVNTNPLITDNSMVIRGNHYRISILSDMLLRLEYHPEGIFYDNETQLVQFRNFPKADFQVTQDSRYLVVKTKYFTLSYTKERSFDGGKLMPMANLKVDLNGTDRSWYYHHPGV